MGKLCHAPLWTERLACWVRYSCGRPLPRVTRDAVRCGGSLLAVIQVLCSARAPGALTAVSAESHGRKTRFFRWIRFTGKSRLVPPFRRCLQRPGCCIEVINRCQCQSSARTPRVRKVASCGETLNPSLCFPPLEAHRLCMQINNFLDMMNPCTARHDGP